MAAKAAKAPWLSRCLLLGAAAIVVALSSRGSAFAPVGRSRANSPHGEARGGPAEDLPRVHVPELGAAEPQPRRSAAWGLLLAAGLAAAAGAKSVRAFEIESNRIATYNSKAKQLNDAVDWWLFDVRPLVYPAQELLALSDCEADGDRCPERAGLSILSDMYKVVGATRGGGGVVLSKLDRALYAPMKTLATANVFDPDTEEELGSDAVQMEKNQTFLGQAARRGDLQKVRKQFDECDKLFNSYFTKVNAATGLPAKTEFYLTPIPTDSSALENDNYWVRRHAKYITKKKVDATSKGSKTARFYAKSIFGDDAVSWDPRGDRASEFM